MPAALSTTKRKFHRLLDSISNASSTSLAAAHGEHDVSTLTLPADIASPAKKARVSRPASSHVSPSMRLVATSNQPSRPTSVVIHRPSAIIEGDPKYPNFAPWDRAQFLERLKTYRHVDKWMGKPEKIGEVNWAKRGWSCVGKETVGCVGGCSKEVVIGLESSLEDKRSSEEITAGQDESGPDEDEDDWREKAQEQLVDKYAEMITDAHEDGCLWRRRGCDDTIYRLPLAHQSTALEDLRQRHLSLLAMASELPPDPTIPEHLNLSDFKDSILPILDPPPTIPQTDGTPPEHMASSVSPTLNLSALSLAVFGWQAEEGHISGLATCTACFRRLGLWLFKNAMDAALPSSMDRLDVVGEHRDYCPWVNALSQNGAASRRSSLEGLSGWEILVRGVKANATHKKYDHVESSPIMPEVADETASEVGSIMSLTTTKGDRVDQDEKDKERWAKLKKLKQVFHVKRGKGKERIDRKPGAPLAELRNS